MTEYYVPDVASRTDDLRMIGTPAMWPRWPMLPMKRSGGPGGIECGVLVAGRGPKIYLRDLWRMEGPTIGDALKGAKVLEYDSFETMQLNGWRID